MASFRGGVIWCMVHEQMKPTNAIPTISRRVGCSFGFEDVEYLRGYDCHAFCYSSALVHMQLIR